MPIALYRKYRPQAFAELVGQNHIKVTLQNEIETGRISHAYIFCGPRAIGKTTTARLFAKAVNCEKRKSGQSEPCNKCDSCQEIIQGKALDIIEIDAASHTGVDNVRENIIDNARTTPTSRKYKVFIIDEVHMLSISAFNALLKTMEEPPEHAIFILATTEIHKVPETIISRCQRFDFKKIALGDLVERLTGIAKKEKIKVSQEVLENIARRSEGCARDAESILGQILSLGEKEISPEIAELVIPRSDINQVLTFFEHLVKKDIAQGIEMVNKLMEEGVSLPEFTKEMIEFLRQILIIKVSGKLESFASLGIDKEKAAKVLELVQELDYGRIINMVNIFLDKLKDLKYAEIPQLPLELAVVEICQGDTGSDDDDGQDTGGNSQGTTSEYEKVKVKLKKEQADEQVKKKTSATKLSSQSLEKNNATQGASLAEIKDHWKKVLKAVKKKNHSLAVVLKVANLVSLQEDVLSLGYRYKFYSDRVRDSHNLDVVESAITEITNKKVRVECLVGEEFAAIKEKKVKNQDNGVQDNTWNAALEAFGGQVVE